MAQQKKDQCPDTRLHCNDPEFYNNSTNTVALTCDPVSCAWDLALLDPTTPPQLCLDEAVQVNNNNKDQVFDDRHEPCVLWEFQYGALATTPQGPFHHPALVCGDPNNGECQAQGPPPTYDILNLDHATYGVRCCNEQRGPPFVHRNDEYGCTTFVASHNIGGPTTTPTGDGCARAATWQQAILYCSMAGGRVCTTDEAEQRCTSGSGCQLNRQFVWTLQTATDPPTKAPTTLPPSKPPTPAPSPAPTDAPTPAPTSAPTPAPTNEPTRSPTNGPTPGPTDAPTPAPSSSPVTLAPTAEPKVETTPAPVSPAPTETPTTLAPVSSAPVSSAPVSNAPVSNSPTTAPTKSPTIATASPVVTATSAPVDQTSPPTTLAPTPAPSSLAPTTAAPVEENNDDDDDDDNADNSPLATPFSPISPFTPTSPVATPTLSPIDKDINSGPAAAPVTAPSDGTDDDDDDGNTNADDDDDSSGDDDDDDEPVVPKGVSLEIEEFEVTMFIADGRRRRLSTTAANRQLTSLSVETQAILQLSMQRHILRHVGINIQLTDLVVATAKDLRLVDGTRALVETIGGRVMLQNNAKDMTMTELNDSIQKTFRGNNLHDFLIVLLKSPDPVLQRVFDLEYGIPPGLDIFANGNQSQKDDAGDEEGNFSQLSILAGITLIFLLAFLCLLCLARRAGIRKVKEAMDKSRDENDGLLPATPSTYNHHNGSDGGIPENIDRMDVGIHNFGENTTISELAGSEYGFYANGGGMQDDADTRSLYSYRDHSTAGLSLPTSVNNDTGSFAASYFHHSNNNNNNTNNPGETSSQSSGMWSIFDGVMSVDGSLKKASAAVGLTGGAPPLSSSEHSSQQKEGYSIPQSIMPPRVPTVSSFDKNNGSSADKENKARPISPMTVGTMVQELGSLVQDGISMTCAAVVVDCDDTTTSVATPPPIDRGQQEVPDSLMGQAVDDDDNDSLSYSRPASGQHQQTRSALSTNLVSDDDNSETENTDFQNNDEDDFEDEGDRSLASSKNTYMTHKSCVLIEDIEDASQDDITLTSKMGII